MGRSKGWPAAIVALLVIACEANASMRAGGDTTSAKASATATSETPTTVTQSTPPPAPTASSAPPPDTTTLPAGCSLVCAQPNVGRVAAADEARLTSGLAATAHALEACYPQKPTHTFQLRFNSASSLTGFGVDIDDQDGPACMIGIRSQTPAITMPGPSTVRCTEKCKR